MSTAFKLEEIGARSRTLLKILTYRNKIVIEEQAFKNIFLFLNIQFNSNDFLCLPICLSHKKSTKLLLGVKTIGKHFF